MLRAITRLQVNDTEREEANSALSLLERATLVGDSGLFVNDTGGRTILGTMPAPVFAAIRDILTAFAESGEALVMKPDAEISPQQAAEFLGISVPLVHHRRKAGRLPFPRTCGGYSHSAS
ncbi:MAG: hypothetical protein FWD68_11575 [Alphaproteobacteria bacterium]|nr:hypothetical protein [Alphaproteobacteria bacterium]